MFPKDRLVYYAKSLFTIMDNIAFSENLILMANLYIKLLKTSWQLQCIYCSYMQKCQHVSIVSFHLHYVICITNQINSLNKYIQVKNCGKTPLNFEHLNQCSDHQTITKKSMRMLTQSKQKRKCNSEKYINI